MASTGFTDARLRNEQPAKRDRWISDPKTKRGEGALSLRIRPDARKEFYFRERREGRNRLVRIGRFQQTPSDGGLSVSEARERHKALSEKSRLGGVKEQLAMEREALQRKIEAHQREAKAGALTHLLADYVAHLRAENKVSADEVERELNRSVLKAFPALARKRARDITPSDIQTILAALVQSGVTRGVNKVLAYLRAAYNYGAESEFSPRRAAAGKVNFGLTGNPAALVEYQRDFDRTGKRTLTEGELALFWGALDDVNPVHAATLRLNLLLGGQRIEQLLRGSFDARKSVLHLRDSKGKGATRDHLVPVIGPAKEEIDHLRAINQDALFNGATGKRLRVDSLSCTVGDVRHALAKQHGVKHFRMGDLRRTCETMLAAIGIDKETRAQLLSHGRASGVQGKHYDMHHYLPEKERALRKWHAKLNEILTGEAQPKVVKLR